MDREEIKKYLPHRDDMLLVDFCEKDGENKSRGEYTIRGDEFFLNGHFPNFKVVPGVILCEIMAQCCFPIFIDDLKGKMPMYASIKNARFKKQVMPCETVKVSCEIIKTLRPFYTVKCVAKSGENVCATGELMFCLVDDARKQS